MYFNVVSKSGPTTISRILNASSWSNSLSYMEGTGEDLQSIALVSSNTTVIVTNASSNKIYNIILKDNISEAISSFILVDDSYSSVETWISQQTNKTPTLVQQQEKSYVTV